MNALTRILSRPLTLLLPLTVMLAGCSADAPQADPDVGVDVVNEPAPEVMMVGNDRDEHGCIGSAGYVWSEVMSDCVRLFEAGIPLDNMQEIDSIFVAYLIAEDANRLELFEPGRPPVILTSTTLNTWQDKDQILTANLTASGQYDVYKEGVMLYSEDRYALDQDSETDLLTEFGVLTELEDGAYPFYSMTLDFPKNQTRASFTLNAEAVTVDIADLYARLNQTISIDYVSDMTMDVMEVELDTGFLRGTDNRETLQDYKSMSGIMSGASVTMGDLPGTFYVEDANGNRTAFEDYVTEDMLAGNRRPVTIYYSERYQNKIIAIDLGVE